MLSLKEFFKDFKIDEFIPFKLDSKLSSLDLDKDILLYFNSEDNVFLEKFIQDNYSLITSQFTETGKNFIYLPNVEYPTSSINEIIKFYFPSINKLDLVDFNFTIDALQELAESFFGTDSSYPKSRYTHRTKEVLDYLGYKGNIKSGVVFFYNEKIYIIECDDRCFLSSDLKPFSRLLDFFSFQKQENDRLIGGICFSPRGLFPKNNPYDNLDAETIEKIEQIQNQLKDLKETGQMLLVLPILKKIIKSIANDIDLSAVSEIRISEDYKIILPYFDHLEIQMSHLTKVVYLLFYNHPRGINIKELSSYKSELKDLYSQISNQSDYDKMMKSIDDLVDPNSKSIYTHISRIKSVFYKEMDKVYADNYIISSDRFGSDLKYITIMKPSDVPYNLDDINLDNIPTLEF